MDGLPFIAWVFKIEQVGALSLQIGKEKHAVANPGLLAVL
jgi:hypothetical protein